MDNKTKYELIVKIKELQIDTKIKTVKDLRQTELISLNASKVLRLIYENSELESFYKSKVNEYYELMQNEKLYNKTHELREKQILSYIPNEYRKIGEIPGYTIDIYQLFNRSDAKEIMESFEKDIIDCINSYAYFSIFQYVDRIRTYFYSNILPSVIYDYEKSMKMFDLFSHIDNDEYRRKITNLYDYYYMDKYELLTGISQYYWVINYIKKLYLYVAYKKILDDCLNYTYSLNLSEDEQQEYNINNQLSMKRIYFDDYEELKELTNASRSLLEYIAISKDLDDLKSILKIMNNGYEHLSQTIRSYITEYFEPRGLLKKGGYSSIKRLLREHPEWFKPKSIQK